MSKRTLRRTLRYDARELLRLLEGAGVQVPPACTVGVRIHTHDSSEILEAQSLELLELDLTSHRELAREESLLTASVQQIVRELKRELTSEQVAKLLRFEELVNDRANLIARSGQRVSGPKRRHLVRTSPRQKDHGAGRNKVT